MPHVVRPFDRADRDQLTSLVNLHVTAVLPGIGLSVNTVMSQLEREPLEVVVDPWVSERRCVVVVDNHTLVAAALIHRYRADADVGDEYRNAGEIRWLLCLRDQREAGGQLMRACLAQFDGWAVDDRYADGSLPVMGCYGVPDTWPHIRQIFRDAGFEPSREEIVLTARCADLATVPMPTGVEVQRSVGLLGARFQLMRAGSMLGYIEVGEHHPDMARSTSAATWTDVGNLVVSEREDSGEVMPALLSVAASWLQLGGVDRLIDYYASDVHTASYLETLIEVGFVRLVTNQRGWRLAAPREPAELESAGDSW